MQSIRRDGDRSQRMRAVVDALWEYLHSTGISWVGFYVQENAHELVLAVCRNKPACSPIGMHGACGRSFRERRPMIVRDVRKLGESYIACDPRDLSELVLPCLDGDGECWGVLDVDSHEAAAFDVADLERMHGVLIAAGLTADAPLDAAILI